MADSPPPVPHDICMYEPPVSLWALVEAYVPQHEWQEVKLILGESLVEQSLELQEEVATLLEIWRDYRSETDSQQKYRRLPEPPAARDRLVQEIRFFVENIREKTSQGGRDVEDVFSKHNKDVLEYVLENKKLGNGFGSRPSTARSSQDGRDTPMAMLTPDRLSQCSSVSDQVDSMQDQLSFLKLDEVVQHLRETISQEVDWLMEDIDFLQKCLEDEADFRCGAKISREPTLTDLREERSKLEKELLSNQAEIPKALRTDTTHIPAIKPIVLPNKVSNVRSGPPPLIPSPAVNSRSSPLKATHQISTQVPVLQMQDSNRQGALRPQSNITHSKQSLNHAKEFVKSRQGSQVLVKAVNKDPAPSQAGDRSHRQNHSVANQRLLADSSNHLTIRTATLANNAKVVTVSGIPASTADKLLLAPNPPTTVKPSSGRPGSAQRFRKMVMQCRDDT